MALFFFIFVTNLEVPYSYMYIIGGFAATKKQNQMNFERKN